MSGNVAARLKQLGIGLPEAVSPIANYVPTRRSGNLLIVSGQVPIEAGKPKYTGRLGGDVDLETGVAAARLCGLNVLAHAAAALGGDLDRITACLRLGVFVAAAPDFNDHPKVANGASDLMVEVLGDAGRHARAAVGMSSLPLGVPVEVEAMFEVA
jgi:enamine deaminase RidA (YjgF/YER057c/UK114 family)